MIHAVLRLEQPVKVIWFSGVEPVRLRMDPEKPGELLVTSWATTVPPPAMLGVLRAAESYSYVMSVVLERTLRTAPAPPRRWT